MCRLRNIAMRDYQESVTTGQTDTHTHGQTDAGQSDPYVPLCFTGNTMRSVCKAGQIIQTRYVITGQPPSQQQPMDDAHHLC